MQRSGEFFVKGEIIVLKRDGTWMSSGPEGAAAPLIEITHEETKKLFYRAIEWDATQRVFSLKVGFERIAIQVEDTPYFVTSIDRKNGKITAKLTNETSSEITANNLHYEKNSLYLDVGTQGLRAKFFSAPYYDILKMLEENEKEYFLLIQNSKCVLLPKQSMKN